MDLGQELEDPTTFVRGLLGLGNVARDQNLPEQAAAHYEECLAICRKFDLREGIATALNNLAAVTRAGFSARMAMLGESLALYRELGRVEGAAASLHNMGDAMHESGNWEQALQFYREGLTIERDCGDKSGIALFFESIARVLAEKSRTDRAVRLYARAEVLRELDAAPLPPAGKEDLDRRINAARSTLTAEEFDNAWITGRQLSMEDAIAQALDPSL